MRKGTQRKCKAGHTYYKSSDCPICLVCEKNKSTVTGFYSKLGAPARRALEAKGILLIEQLARYTENEII